MLSANAYSMRKKARLAISLSWVAGYTNVVSFLVFGEYISHMTGNSTNLGRSLGLLQTHNLLLGVALIGSFLFGAFTSGLMTEVARRRAMLAPFVWPIGLEAIALAVFAAGLRGHEPATLRSGDLMVGLTSLAAFAMGLQNATITRISGTVVRTTHVTGVVTDIGLDSAQFLAWIAHRSRWRWRSALRAVRMARVSRRNVIASRLVLLLSIWGSFVLGAVLGAAIYSRWGTVCLWAPAIFLAVLVLRHMRKPIARIAEVDWSSEERVKSGLGSFLPPALAVFELRHGRRFSPLAPDFQIWMEHLRPDARIVVLIMDPRTVLDLDAAMDLAAAARQIKSRGDDLILCGAVPAHYRALRRGGLIQCVGWHNICADLEMAVARGINRADELGANK